MHERRDKVGIRHRSARTPAREPGQPDGLQRQPDGHQPTARRSGPRAHRRSARSIDRHRRPRQDPQSRPAAASSPARSGRTGRAGRSTRTCRTRQKQRCGVRERERRGCGRAASAASARGARSSQATKRRQQRRRRRRSAPRISVLVQPMRVAADEPRARCRAGRRWPEHEARQVERAARSPALSSSRRQASGMQREPDRHVQPEDPLPGRRPRRRRRRPAARRPTARPPIAAPDARAPRPRRSAGTAAESMRQRQRHRRSPPPTPWTARAAIERGRCDGASAARGRSPR